MSLNTLIEVDEENIPIGEIPLQDSISIPDSQHLFEAVRTMLTHELFIVPVVDKNNKLLSLIKNRDVLQALGDVFNLELYGSVITMK